MRNNRSRSTSFSSAYSNGQASMGVVAPFNEQSQRHTTATASIASVYRDSITQLTDMTSKGYPNSIHDPLQASHYLNLPLPDYNADDLEEEYYLRRRFAYELPAGALLFAFGFILFPLWWIGSILSIPGGAVLDKEKEPEQNTGQGTGEAFRLRALTHHRWRLLNRIMSAVSFALIAVALGVLLWWYYRY
jgi:hypothetical protein